MSIAPHQLNEAKTRHLPQLDLLRAWAIIAVVLYHGLHVFGADHLLWGNTFRDFTAARDNNFLYFYPFTLGWAGVPLFFVLSGFVIHLSFLQSERKFDVLHFYWRRFWRVYPAYVVALIVFAFWDRGVISFVLHALFLHNVSNQTFFSINSSFWSIAVEMQFYALYPVLLVLRHRFGIHGAFWCTVIISLLSRLVIIKFSAGSLDTTTAITQKWALTPIVWMDWVLGALVAEYFVQNKRLFGRPWIFIALVAAVIATQTRYLVIISFSLFSIGFAALIEEVIRLPRNDAKSRTRILESVGVFSYSIYLWHQPIIKAVGNYFNDVELFSSTITMYLVVLIAALIPTLCLAYLSFVYVEKAGQSLGNRLWKKLFEKPVVK